MANTQAIVDVFRIALLNGDHAFGTSVRTKDVFKAALYLASATYNRSTTAYSATGEVSGTNYSAGGVTVTNATAPANTGGTGIIAFWTPSANIVFASVTLTTAFDAFLLYNATTSGNPAVAVFTFGSQTVTAGNFTISMPVNDLTNGLIRIS